MPAPHAPRRRATLLAVVLAAAASITGCGNDAPAADPAVEPAGGAITLWTDSTELFMEHPALIVGAPDKFAVHLTDRTDFAPLRSGRITLRFVPRDGGAPVVVVQDEPRAPGIYGPAPEFTRPGIYDLTILVESPQARDSLTVPGLQVYATAADAPVAETEADEGIAFLKEQQWKTPGFRMTPAATGTVVTSVDAPGTIDVAPGRRAEVTAPIAAMVDAAGVAASPVPGQRVARGATLALLVPALGDGGSSYASARAELAEAQHEFDRATRLLAAEAVSERRMDEAKIRLTAAREALAGLSGGALTASGKLVVRAPISGEIVARSIVAGSRVDAGTLLFTVIDPSVVWLTAHVPSAAAAQVTPGSRATFRLDGAERSYQSSRMISVGSVIDPVSRTVPVIFEVANPDRSIRIGAAAQVALQTGGRETGVVIPASSIVDDNGQPVAFVQLHGEAFERRVLTLGATDNGRTLVRSGVRAGEFVVSGAAYQVRLASLSTAVPAHGHEH